MANEKENPMAKIIAKCWQDEEFKNRLMADPNAVLSAEGVVIPDGVTVKVFIDTERVQHLIIPPHILAADALASICGGKIPPQKICSWSGADRII